MSILAALIEPVAGIISKFVPDKDKANALAHDIATLAEKQHHQIMLGQMEINKADAKSGNWWQAGWRPFFGWAGGMAFVNNFILIPWAQAAGLEIVPMDWATMERSISAALAADSQLKARYLGI